MFGNTNNKTKGILILLILILNVSCSSQWWVKKAMEKAPESFKTDSVVTTEIIKEDTTIYVDVPILVQLPKDTVEIIKKLPCKIKPIDDIYQKNGIIHMKIGIRNNAIHAKSWLDSAIWYQYQDSILLKDAIITSKKTIIKEQAVIISEKDKKLTIWQKIGIIGICLGGLLIVGIVIKIIRWIKNQP